MFKTMKGHNFYVNNYMTMIIIGKLPEWHKQKKYITNEDNNIIWVYVEIPQIENPQMENPWKSADP